MAARLSEHPVLVPTSLGPAGGIVCEPAGRSGAALLFLHTGGHSGRAGFGSEWARLSRRLAALGTTVLRLDLSTEGDSSLIGEEVYRPNSPDEKVAADRQLVREAGAWFAARTAPRDLIVTGACYGSRLALDLAESQPGVSAALMVVPYFRRNSEEDRGGWKERMQRVQSGQPTDDLDRAERGDLGLVDPPVIGQLEMALRSVPVWILVGERDATGDALALDREFGARGLEVDVEPGVALYPGNEPDVQELVGDRVVERVSRLLAAAAAS